MVSIGKLHFRGRAGDDHGFSEQVIPMHIVEAAGDLIGLRRDAGAAVRGGAKKLIAQAGPGESDYTRYDRMQLPVAIKTPPAPRWAWTRSRVF